MSADPELAVGEEFAGFRIEEVLGHGGMGTVYRARDLRLDVDRALKVLDPRLARDAGFRERFTRESRLAARIDNETVLPVHQAGEEEGRLFIAMRLVRGPDLNRLVAGDGPLEPQRTSRVVTAVAGALDAAHALGIVHRDIKPANILVELGERERIWLADFGISRPSRSESQITATGELLGTPDYVSPEQIEGKRVDARADIYSLGCVVCFLLTGEPPFRRETDLATLYAHTQAERPRPSLLEPALPEAVDEVVARATAVDPRERYPSAGELAAALDAAIRGVTPAQPARTALTRELETRVPGGPAVPVAVAAVVALIAIAALLIPGGDEGGGGGGGAPPAPDVTSVDIGVAPSAIAIGENNVLAVSEKGGELVPIDPAEVRQAGVPREIEAPTSVAVGFSSVWVTDAAGDRVLRYAPGARDEPIQIPVGDGPADIAVGKRWVWVANRGDGSVARIEPNANRVDARIRVDGHPTAVAAGDDATWTVSPDSGTLTRMARTAPARRVRETDLGGSPSDLALGEGALWVVDPEDGSLTEVGRVDADPEDEIDLGGSPVAVATGPDALWVVDSRTRELVELDPASGARRRDIPVEKRPVALAVGTDAVWVANAGARSVSRVTP
ncbi:MAG TPA: serine/threonine-protein kinase [Solirubrobacterales bacterium]|nr:serine/threonine-protein kinase [Solirubrobacterales bacterium]